MGRGGRRPRHRPNSRSAALALGAQTLGTALSHVIGRLLVGLLCLGLGIGAGSEAFDRLAEAHGAGAGYFGLERIKAAGDVEVLGHVGCCNALAEVLDRKSTRLNSSHT